MVKEYFQPLELTEALAFLASGSAHVLAGGTDLLVNIRNNKIKPIGIVDLSKVAELKQISREGDSLVIGALVTFTELAAHPLIQELVPALVSAAKAVGSPQIRNRGTVGGNIANASPAADVVPALVALDGTLTIAKKDSTRNIALSELIVGPYKTNLQPDEIITKVTITIPEKGTGQAYFKVARRNALAISRLNGMCLLRVKKGIIGAVSLVIGSATSTPHRFQTVEEFLVGKNISEELLAKAGVLASEYVLAKTGRRSSSVYKLPVIERLTVRLLHDAWQGGKANE